MRPYKQPDPVQLAEAKSGEKWFVEFKAGRATIWYPKIDAVRSPPWEGRVWQPSRATTHAPEPPGGRPG